MTEEQARALAAEIEQQFPHTEAHVISTRASQAPDTWFVTVEWRDDADAGCLSIHSRQEWNEAVEAFNVLKH